MLWIGRWWSARLIDEYSRDAIAKVTLADVNRVAAKYLIPSNRTLARFIPTDNAVVSAAESVIQVAEDKGTPVFASDESTMERGAAAGLSVNYTQQGRDALLLQAGDAVENIPFFVVPPQGTATARVAVLVSTYTYTVYGNHARPEWMIDPAWRAALVAQNRAWNAYPYNPGEHRDYGLSTYNVHPDGSGIALVSWRRPMLNLRIGYVTYPYPDIRGSGLRHYPADSHLLLWLAQMGHDVDLITDDELHHEGQALLAPYKVVVTGSHPEYHTPQMLDALQAYRDTGGKLVYLGGNGFYWKIAQDPARDGVLEVRRAEGGIRAWAAEPGEYFQQFDGQYGGLWRRNARPPQKLVGVGFTAQGNFVGSHYRIDPAARQDPRVAWVLAGVQADTVGGEGFSGHGAAGFELDRVDTRLGSPANAVVIARSENHPPEAPWVLVPEEQLTHITTIPGQPHKDLIRAEVPLFESDIYSVDNLRKVGRELYG